MLPVNEPPSRNRQTGRQIAIGAGQFDTQRIGLRLGWFEIDIDNRNLGFVAWAFLRHPVVAAREPVMPGALPLAVMQRVERPEFDHRFLVRLLPDQLHRID
jgi:hypothetical protein